MSDEVLTYEHLNKLKDDFDFHYRGSWDVATKPDETLFSWLKTKPRVLITGITGQDGSYLAEWLLHKGYEVHGITRRSSTDNLERIRHILNDITLHEGDITDSQFVMYKILDYDFQEIYNLAAQSHVQTSFEIPDYTFQVNTIGLLNILNAVKISGEKPKIYQASSSEMFGNVPAPQSLDSEFVPVSPYACSKMSSHDLVNMYREAYGMYIVSGILFNHESPRRGENFVTRKITKYFSGVDSLGKLGMDVFETPNKLQLGNINAMRDWGFAPDYVKIMWESLQKPEAKDFVLGTGRTISVYEFLDLVGKYLDLDWKNYVIYDNPDLLRIKDVYKLQAYPDYSVPTYVEELVEIMIDYDNQNVPGKGYEYYMDNYGEIFSWRT